MNPILIPKEKEIKTESGQQIVPVFAATGKKQTESGQQKEKTIELDLIFKASSKNKTENSLYETVISSEVEKPSLEMILEYFSFKESSQIEANKFFNYYSSIGWLIGGKTKMQDCKAAARNWMLNTAKFAANVPKTHYNSQPKPMHLHTATQKNYSVLNLRFLSSQVHTNLGLLKLLFIL